MNVCTVLVSIHEDFDELAVGDHVSHCANGRCSLSSHKGQLCLRVHVPL